MKVNSRYLSRVCIRALCLVLAACQSGPTAREVYYQLAPRIQSNPSGRESCGTVLVGKLATRGFAGGRAIVFRDQANSPEIQRYSYHLWSEPPAGMIQDAIVRSLRATGIPRYVITPVERANADWIVSGTLIRLEHYPNASPARVEIEAELGLVAAKTHETLFLERYLESEPAASNGIEDAVRAFNKALERLLMRFQKDASEILIAGRALCR